MAVAFGTSSVRAYAAATTSVVITKPTSTASGDVLIAQVFIFSSTENVPAGAVSAPDGTWTAVGTQMVDPGGAPVIGGSYRVACFIKTAGGSEGANYTFTFTGGASAHGVMLRYTGANGTPNASNQNLGTGSPTTTTRTFGSLTTTAANCMLVAVGWDWADNANNLTPPTSFTERLDTTTLYVADFIQTSAGASGTISHVSNAAATSPKGGWLVALEAAGAGSVNGTLGVTIDPVTQSTNGDLLVQGSLAQTISAFTQTATGQLLVKGSLAGTIDPVTLSATGKLLVQGSLSGTIDPVTLSTNGDLLVQGSLSQTIPAVTQTATGQVVLNGSLTQTIAPVTLSANGSVVIQGSFGQTIDPVTLTASGSSASGGALNATIDPVTLSATGAVIIQGNFGQTIAPVTQAATGALTVKGTFGQTIDPVTLAASAGGIPDANNGSLGQTIGPITLAANGSSPSQFRATSSGRGTSYAYKTLTELREEEKTKLAALQKRASKVVAKVISGPGILTADLAEIVQDAVEATPQYKSLAPDMVDFIAAAIEAKFRKAFERRLEEEDDEEAMLLAA